VNVLIVDDEPPARRRMRRLLADLPGVEVVGEAGSADQALAALAARGADVVLLDIRMPGLDGLELVARYAELPPVIFVTAHDEFAVRAFELDAVDYLLKPVRPERLAAALDRVRRRARRAEPSASDPPRLADALARLSRAGGAARPRVVVMERGAVRLFDACAVARYWAEDKYTLFLADGAERLTLEPLVELEARLAPHGYLRVHRAELIDVARVRALVSDASGQLAELDDGQRARVSRRRAAELRAALGLADREEDRGGEA
jgi:DNA-binding LytR/AlgR family response regulator